MISLASVLSNASLVASLAAPVGPSVRASALQAASSNAEVLADSASGAADSLAVLASGSDSLVAAGASVAEAATAETGLSMGEVLASVPTDPASVFSLLLLLGCTILVLRYGLQKGGNETKVSNRSESPTSGPSPKS